MSTSSGDGKKRNAVEKRVGKEEQDADAEEEGSHPHAESGIIAPTNAAAMEVKQNEALTGSGKPQRKRLKGEISREEIESCFHMPQHEAAKKLNCSISTIKRRFYELDFGLARWPYSAKPAQKKLEGEVDIILDGRMTLATDQQKIKAGSSSSSNSGPSSSQNPNRDITLETEPYGTAFKTTWSLTKPVEAQRNLLFVQVDPAAQQQQQQHQADTEAREPMSTATIYHSLPREYLLTGRVVRVSDLVNPEDEDIFNINMEDSLRMAFLHEEGGEDRRRK